MTSRKPILVTGSPRSGSTWVGRMIASAPAVRYIHEPFNVSGRPCSCGTRFDYWFFYVTKENETYYRKHIGHILGSSLNRFQLLNLITEMRVTRRLRLLANYARSFTATRPLVKDPLALCSAEWLASAFDMDIIVVIRHPAAFVNSYKRLNWSHPFSHFLSQPLLIRDHLSPFEAEIGEFVNHTHDIVDRAALLWRLLHHIIREYQQTHPDWCFVRHEDLSQDPLSGFRTIFDKLNLEFGDRVCHAIQKHSGPANPTESQDPYSIRLSSEQVTQKWKVGLTPQEIERVRMQVEDVASSFYSAEDW